MAGFIWLSNYFAGKAFYIETLCVHVCTVISMVDPPLSNMPCRSTALPIGFIKNPGGRICIHWTTFSGNCQHPIVMALLKVFYAAWKQRMARHTIQQKSLLFSRCRGWYVFLKIDIMFDKTDVCSINFSRRAERIEPGDEMCLLLNKNKDSSQGFRAWFKVC